MSSAANNTTPYAIVGIVAALLFAVLWTVAAKADASWVFGESMLSDLGVSDVRMSAYLFNYGCVITGALVLFFGTGKALYETGSSRTSGVLIAIAGFFLVGVGVFNEGFADEVPHLICAYTFFVCLVLGILFSIVGDAAEGRRLNACVSGMLVVFAIAVAVGHPIAYIEAITVACGLAWIIAESVKMLIGPGAEEEQSCAC